MTRKSREFELLVSRIESAFKPMGATVTSPDYLVDVETGEEREVDVSVKYQIGTVPVVITIECRDRSRTDDVTWIDGLATKRNSLRIAKTIAVSSSGFSKQALKKARFHGIETRITREIDADDIHQWLAFTHVTYRCETIYFLGLGLELYESDPEERCSLDAGLQELYKKEGSKAQVIIRNMDGKRFSADDMLVEWRKRGRDLFEGVQPNGAKVRRKLRMAIAPGCLHTLTERGPCDIQAVYLLLDVAREQRFVPMHELFEYRDDTQALIQGAEAKLDLPDKSLVLSVHRDLASGETRFNVTDGETGSEPRNLLVMSRAVRTCADTRYVTKSGKSYHKAGCPALRRSSAVMCKDEAIRQGYTPCNACDAEAPDTYEISIE